MLRSFSVAVLATGLIGGAAALAQAADEPPLATPPGDPALQWGPCPPILPAGCQIAVLHGNPAEANADIFLRVPAGYEIPPHRHSSAERMILVTGLLRVKYKGTPEATLSPGHYAYGPAGRPHRASCLGDQPCTLFIAFVGPVDAEAVAESVD